MSVNYIAFPTPRSNIAQNLGNKAKPHDHDPLGYFRYPGYEVGLQSVVK